MTFTVAYTRAALKDLDGIDKPVVERIRRFFEDPALLEDPRSSGRPLRGRSEWRYRVGDYRILCHIGDEIVEVLVVRVAHRREVYR